MKVLLTGYSGFLGRHLENHLRREGYSIRILLHRTAVMKRELDKTTEVLWGSFDDSDVVKQAVAGVKIVVHAAWAFSSAFVQRPTVNERAAELLLRESIRAGVDFFALISSVAVYGMDSKTNSLIDESSPLINPDDHSFVYPSEKVAIETFCRSWERKSTKLGIFRPGPIFDEAKGPIKRIVRIAGRSFGIGIGNGRNRVGYIHADDVARSVVMWLKWGKGDLIINVTPTITMSHIDWYRNWGMVVGQQLKPIFIHPTIIRFTESGVKMLKKMLGKQSQGDIRYAIACEIRDHCYSNEALKKTLAWNDDATSKYTGLTEFKV